MTALAAFWGGDGTLGKGQGAGGAAVGGVLVVIVDGWMDGMEGRVSSWKDDGGRNEDGECWL